MASDGARIGPYVVLGKLGAGGMGEVYLAEDPRLAREVALKMLPREFARDAERVARFRREALALAAINHPNIATIFGLETTGSGALVLVLERVEGETLGQRLRRGPFPPADALGACAQIAEALEAAHARGVIHRDLKPGNVMLGSRGLVKILDFGLAHSTSLPPEPSATASPPPTDGNERLAEAETLAAAPADTDEPETTVISDPDLSPADLASPITTRGGVTGTPGYMSPEQVTGGPQDERTDIFAFGCVLYECLAGTRAFSGRTIGETITAVLEASPDWARLPDRFPPRIRTLLARCLERDPGRRLASIRDARLEIEEALGIRRASALRTGEALAETPGNLPRPATSFVGRESEIAACREALESTRLLTLTGVGGSGKTRLAVRVAEELRESFADGTWFVDLSPLSDPERVPKALARVLGVEETPGTPPTRAVVDHLANRRAMLVLDNCEHLLGACRALADALLSGAPELTIIATSREALGTSGERVSPVPALSVPEAAAPVRSDAALAIESVRLFVERAAQAHEGFSLTDDSAPVVVDLCRRLDGIPLAIELAAARTKMLSVEEIRDKLDDRFRLLAGGKSALPRHKTLAAAFRWSYDHLEPDEQALLRTLSVFAGGWTLDAATACRGDEDPFETLDLLTRLVDKSLVVVKRTTQRETRYRFLETVRQFAGSLLDTSGEGRLVRNRHRDWVVRLAEEALLHLHGPDQAAWFDRLEAENDNLRAALGWCLDGGADPMGALRIAGPAHIFWTTRGFVTEGREWLSRALESAGDIEPGPALALAHQGAGNLAFRVDDYPAARASFERSLAIREKLGDRRAVAGLLGSLGNVAQYEGRLEEARELFLRSLAINREMGNRLWEGANLTCLGNVTRLLDETDAARKYLEDSAALNRSIGNAAGESLAVEGLGDLLLHLGDLAGASAALERALAIQREVGDRHGEALTILSLGKVAWAEGDGQRARTLLRRALSNLLPMGARLQIAVALEAYTTLFRADDRDGDATRLFAAAASIRSSVGAERAPEERAAQERELAALRGSMGDAAFAAAWRDGSEMTIERAVEHAIGESGRDRSGAVSGESLL